jgi:hypothetical protein
LLLLFIQKVLLLHYLIDPNPIRSIIGGGDGIFTAATRT